MRLVVLPEFDVQNLVPTVYHLNYECNLTLYNMACEVPTNKRHGCGKALLVICDIEPKLWTDSNMNLILGHSVHRSEIE